MILDYQYIIDIINNRPNYDVIKAAQEQYEKLYMHYTGVGIENYVSDLDEFMREGAKDTLTTLLRSNRDVIHRVMNPRNKIYIAKGGLEQYNLPESDNEDFKIFLAKIADGLPLAEWIRQRVQQHYDYDPNGLIQIEINANDEPYPKIRCITEVYDYMTNGRALEYVVFEVSERERQAYIASGLIVANTPQRNKVYRVIDDAFDRIVILPAVKGRGYSMEVMTVSSEIANEFGYVPCQIISDIWGTGNCFDSPLSVVTELLDDILEDNGLFNWAYWRGVFPKEWMQKFECPTCDGKKEINGEACPECKGSGMLPFMRTADVAIVDYRNDNNKSIPTPPIGRIDSDIKALEFMRSNGMTLEDYFDYTIWGVSRMQHQVQLTHAATPSKGNVSNTAYEAQLNEQPRHDRLKLFGRWKVSIMSFVIDACAWYKYRDNFEGSAIICGDRFMIESPDATWDRYNKAVAAKAPMFALDTLLQEYNENKFEGNPELYRRAELMRQVEPFVHEDVAVIWPDLTLPLTTRLMKKYFDEWTSTVTDFDIASVPDEGGADILRVMLFNWVTGKYISDKKMDSMLLTATGEIIALGTQVKVIYGKQRNPDHLGEIFTVTDIVDRNVTIKGGGMDGIFGYTVDDVYNVQQKQIA